jgi:hypothetical protein
MNAPDGKSLIGETSMIRERFRKGKPTPIHHALVQGRAVLH